MNGVIKRISPRRPFQVTPAGLKRIVLGEVGDSGGAMLAVHRDAAPKPLRLVGEPTGCMLVIAHSDRGTLDAHAQQAIAAAALLAASTVAVALLVLGDLGDDLSAYGADRVYVAARCDRAVFDPASELAVASALIEQLQPLHVIMPDNAVGDGDLGRRLAASIGAETAAHVVELNADGVAAYWRGGSEMARRGLPRIVLIDPDTTETALPFRGAGESVAWEAPVGPTGAYTDLGSPPVDFAALGLEDADFIVSAGNGVRDVATFQGVAKAFDAAIGASRVAVDDGRFGRHQQIGATGKTVNASVYLAVGISGAVQHLQGIKAVRHVIAINSDASAPIAKRADLTIVDDAQAVMSELLEATRGRNFGGNDPSVDPLPLRGEGQGGGAGATISGLPTPPPSLPRQGGGVDRVRGQLRVTVLAALGRNAVSSSARANGNDLLALELGRQLGGPLRVVHAGDSAEPAVADYLAYGAERVEVVPTVAGQDVVASLVGQLAGQDVILCGTRAEGGEGSGLVPYLVAERLGLPIVAQALEVRVADGHAEIVQGLPKGQCRRVRMALPAVVVVHPKAPAKPRFAYARKLAGRVVVHPAESVEATASPWRTEPAGKRPVKFKAAETKAGHARMLSAIATEAKGGAVISSGTPADKAQAILRYLRDHKLIDW